MQVPGPVRAFVGLMAVTAEEARRLPDRAIELPMLAVSTALQATLRAQQRYARLAARGADVLNHRPPSDEPPPWATFDDPVPADEVPAVSDDTSPAVDAPPNAVPKIAAKRAAAARKGPAKRAGAARKTTGKTISRPRNTPPSRFDDVQDV